MTRESRVSVSRSQTPFVTNLQELNFSAEQRHKYLTTPTCFLLINILFIPLKLLLSGRRPRCSCIMGGAEVDGEGDVVHACAFQR